MVYLYLVLGLVFLVLGADLLVRGGVGLAWRVGVSSLLIGLTIVACGTSTPELVVSIEAAIEGNSEIAVGNVVGSSLFNILLILGVTAVLQPIVCRPQALYRDGAFALGTVIVFIVLALVFGEIQFWAGLMMLGLLAGIVLFTYRQEKLGKAGEGGAFGDAELDSEPPSIRLSLIMIPAGLALLIIGADWIVESASILARRFGVSDTVIGLSLVAAGTGLPEVATSIVAAIRRHADMALGNVIGSNILNFLLALGIASQFRTVVVPEQIARVDMWLLFAATAALLLPALFNYKIGRGYGVLFLMAYVVYVYGLFAGWAGIAMPPPI